MTHVFARMDPLEERAEWLRWRRGGIGGSDIAALLGMSRFASPMSVYLDKLGMLADDEGSEQMRWGRLLEQPIAAEYAARTERVIIGEQVIVTNPDRPWERATIDVLAGERATTNLDQATVDVEIKNSADFSWDAIPDEYAVQCQWQMGIAELDRGDLVVLHGGRRLVIYPVEFSPAVFASLRSVAERFWHDRVLAENPPPVDGADATTDALKDAYRTLADGSTVELGDETFVRLAVEWLQRKSDVADAATSLARIENELRVLLAEHTLGTANGVELVTWKPQNTAARFDREGLQRDRPLIAAKYTGEPGTARVLRATKALKELAAS